MFERYLSFLHDNHMTKLAEIKPNLCKATSGWDGWFIHKRLRERYRSSVREQIGASPISSSLLVPSTTVPVSPTVRSFIAVMSMSLQIREIAGANTAASTQRLQSTRSDLPHLAFPTWPGRRDCGTPKRCPRGEERVSIDGSASFEKRDVERRIPYLPATTSAPDEPIRRRRALCRRSCWC